MLSIILFVAAVVAMVLILSSHAEAGSVERVFEGRAFPRRLGGAFRDELARRVALGDRDAALLRGLARLLGLEAEKVRARRDDSPRLTSFSRRKARSGRLPF